jgi:hypothetical protein
VERRGEVLLESEPIRFDGDGRATKLEWQQPDGLAINFLYESNRAGTGVSMRVEPAVDRIRIRTEVQHKSQRLTPVIAYKLAAAADWYGAGLHGNRQRTPAWVGTKGVGLWVRGAREVRYSAGPGRLEFEMPDERAAVHDIVIGRNIRQVADQIGAEAGSTYSSLGFPFELPPVRGDREGRIRRAQAAALMPPEVTCVPGEFDQETARLCREAVQLHDAFAPYMQRLAEKYAKGGEPVLRPLWYNAPNDPQTHAITDQFMLGNDVVVAPVVERGAAARRLYLPAGEWVDWKTKQTVAGGRWIEKYAAPLDTLPIFVRAGFTLDEHNR